MCIKFKQTKIENGPLFEDNARDLYFIKNMRGN